MKMRVENSRLYQKKKGATKSALIVRSPAGSASQPRLCHLALLHGQPILLFNTFHLIF